MDLEHYAYQIFTITNRNQQFLRTRIVNISIRHLEPTDNCQKTPDLSIELWITNRNQRSCQGVPGIDNDTIYCTNNSLKSSWREPPGVRCPLSYLQGLVISYLCYCKLMLSIQLWWTGRYSALKEKKFRPKFEAESVHFRITAWFNKDAQPVEVDWARKK